MEAILDGSPFEALQSLVDKSLVRPVGEDRFDLFSTVRTYASEQLGPDEALSRRHGEYFARFGDPAAVDALRRAGGRERAGLLSHDLENLAAAS